MLGVLGVNAQTHAESGDLVEVFVTGLDRPVDLAFGPQSELYITNMDGRSVMRFNGHNGAFIDEFATVPPPGPFGEYCFPLCYPKA